MYEITIKDFLQEEGAEKRIKELIDFIEDRNVLNKEFIYNIYSVVINKNREMVEIAYYIVTESIPPKEFPLNEFCQELKKWKVSSREI